MKNGGHLEAKDLMIGDWVMYDQDVFNEDEYVASSHQLTPTKINNGEDIDLAREGCYLPIPLTPEILDENGFMYKNGSFFKQELLGDRSYITGGGSKGWFISFEYPINLLQLRIHYVHELQHAIRLCGLTELADNFKV